MYQEKGEKINQKRGQENPILKKEIGLEANSKLGLIQLYSIKIKIVTARVRATLPTF